MTNGDADGFLLFNKRPGTTSFKALSEIKRALGTRKVGHCGTLDSFAEGLLLVFVGRHTKLVQWFSGCDKLYEATVFFGAQTDTLDPEGPVIAEAPPPALEALVTVLDSFRGDILQAPPAYSAIHIDGKRAHELVRAGIEPEMKKRPVTIHELTLLSYEAPVARIRVRCSKGTYIRSLARDIAIAAGSCAHLTALKRHACAGFTLEEACSPGDDEQGKSLIRNALRPVTRQDFDAVGIPVLVVDSVIGGFIRNGRPLDASWFSAIKIDAEALALCSDDGRLLAVLEKNGAAWRYGCVM